MQPLDSSAQERYIFGNYEIRDTAGSGGMGVVYRATDIALGRTVALKILRDDLRAQSHIVARFKREAEAFATLDHPNIVHIHTVGEIGGIPFIAMDYIDNLTLSEVLLDNGPMQWREALAIGRQVADALACAHDSGIIHRDIKPGNILIDHDGTAFVTDFGIAKVLSATTKLTVDGSRLGTPQYMCPERCQNKKITHSSDLYSLGVVLFQAMSMELPYEARTPAELLKQISAGKTARLSAHIPDIPEPVERLIAYMLERDAKHRPPNARELCRAMDRVLAGESLDDGGDTLSWLKAREWQDDDSLALNTPTIPRTKRMGLKDRIAARWFSLGKGLRLLLAGVVVLSLLTPALLSLQNQFMALPYVPTNQQALADALAWDEAAAILNVEHETDSVSLFHLDFDGYQLDSLVSVEGAWDSIYVVLHSDENKGPGLVQINPQEQLASLIHVPGSNPEAFPLAVLAATTLTDETEQLLVLSSGTPYFEYSGDRLSSRLDFHQVQLGIFHPLDDRMVLVTGTDDGTSPWELIETVRQVAGPRHTLLQSDLPISNCAYSHDGSILAYTLDGGDTKQELYIHHSAYRSAKDEQIARGNLAHSSHPFSPDQQFLAYSVTDESGSTIQVRNLVTGKNSVLGEGFAPQWHPSGQFLLAQSPDHANRMQLWRIDAAAPHKRQQLTHLEDGVDGQLLISESGDYAYIPLARQASLVQVRLDS